MDCTQNICLQLLHGYYYLGQLELFSTTRKLRNFFLFNSYHRCNKIIITVYCFFFIRCRFFAQFYPWVPVVHGIVTFFVIANFTLATFMDPGVIPKGKFNPIFLKYYNVLYIAYKQNSILAPEDEDTGDDFQSPLYKSTEVNTIQVRMKWCSTCRFYRPPRCSHCSVCNCCIEVRLSCIIFAYYLNNNFFSRPLIIIAHG